MACHRSCFGGCRGSGCCSFLPQGDCWSQCLPCALKVCIRPLGQMPFPGFSVGWKVYVRVVSCDLAELKGDARGPNGPVASCFAPHSARSQLRVQRRLSCLCASRVGAYVKGMHRALLTLWPSLLVVAATALTPQPWQGHGCRACPPAREGQKRGSDAPVRQRMAERGARFFSSQFG